MKLDANAPSAAALSVASEEAEEALPEGWKYLRAVDLYIVDERGQGHLSDLEAQGAVAGVEDGSDIQLEALPNDPMVDVQGWITGDHVDIGALEAWDLTTGNGAVVVAIIDTGISADHPDLVPNLWTNPNEVAGNGKDDDHDGYTDDIHGYDFWGDDNDVTDDNNHGSHLAGIIGAAGNDAFGVTGINWNVRLMPLKFTDEHGAGTSALAIEAINYAIEHGARVINASWTLKIDGGSSSGRWEQGDLLRQAIDKAGEAGILFVTASGNQFKTYQGLNIDTDPVYPASFANDNMIAVAALDSDGTLADYSNYGPATVDIAAPGSGIYSTGAHGNYAVMSGTSIATAFVTGAAALVLSVDPNLTWDQVKAILEDATEGEITLNGKIITQGSLNLYNALALASGGNVPPPSPSFDSSSGTSSDPSDDAPTAFSPSPSRAFAFPAGGCSLLQ
ncbi:MAG TPA: S8 family peptidase [bacterium]|nr:S8 family peptidase [bacterium]